MKLLALLSMFLITSCATVPTPPVEPPVEPPIEEPVPTPEPTPIPEPEPVPIPVPVPNPVPPPVPGSQITIPVPNASAIATFEVTPGYFTMGQPFVKGAFPQGVAIKAEMDGTPIDIQINRKAHHRDGSLRHAIISGKTAKAGKITLLKSTGSDAFPGKPVSELLKTSFTAELSVVTGGVTWVANAREMLTAGPVKTWIEGKYVTEWHVYGKLKDPQGIASDQLAAHFYIRGYDDLANLRVTVILENGYTWKQTKEFLYDTAVKINGNVVFTQNQVKHYPRARWKRDFWVGQALLAKVKHDKKYMQETRIFPNYDPNLVVPSKQLDHYLSVVNGAVGIMKVGLTTSDMGTTGAADGIGLNPLWTAYYLTTFDERAKEAMLKMAESAGSWSVHFRDEKTGYQATIDDYPFMTIIGSDNNPPFHSTPYVVDLAHQPEFAFIPYAVTGDYFYLEELQFWAGHNLMWGNYGQGYREYSDGIFKVEQVRGQAWAMRTLARAAFITPDDHKLKSYYNDKLQKNINWYNNAHKPGNKFYSELGLHMNYWGTNEGYAGYTAFAVWQEGFVSASWAHILDLDFVEAAPYFEFKQKMWVGIFTEPFCWKFAPRYVLKFRDTGNSPTYTNFRDVYRGTMAWTNIKIADLACDSPEQNALSKVPLGHTIGGNTADGYPSNLQPALAYAVDYKYPRAEEAWNKLMGRKNIADYSYYPIWAVVPRGEVQPSPAPSPIPEPQPEPVPVPEPTPEPQPVPTPVPEPTPIPSPSASLKEIISNMPTGSWVKLPAKNKISNVFPQAAGHPGWGTNGPEGVVKHWSGGAYGENVLFIWGGGHANYGGNEVYTFDLADFTWRRITNPSHYVPGCFQKSNCVTVDGTPVSSHSYDGVEYLPNIKKFWVAGGSPYSEAGGGTNQAFVFDLPTKTWKKVANSVGAWQMSDVDPASGLVITASDATRGIWVYDPVNDKHIGKSGWGWGLQDTSAAWSPDHKYFVALDWPSSNGGLVLVWDLRKFDITKDTNLQGQGQIATFINEGGVMKRFSPPNIVRGGFVYHPGIKKFVWWGGDKDVYFLNPDNWEWTVNKPASGPQTAGKTSGGVYGRWRYMPEYGAFIGYNDINDDPWVYKLP